MPLVLNSGVAFVADPPALIHACLLQKWAIVCDDIVVRRTVPFVCPGTAGVFEMREIGIVALSERLSNGGWQLTDGGQMRMVQVTQCADAEPVHFQFKNIPRSFHLRYESFCAPALISPPPSNIAQATGRRRCHNNVGPNCDSVPVCKGEAR